MTEHRSAAFAAQEYVVKRSTTNTKFLVQQSRNAKEEVVRATSGKKLTVVVLDIEGNTTPLPFVTKVLFPVAVAQYKSFVDKHFPSNRQVAKFVYMAAKDCPAVKSALTEWEKAMNDASALAKVKAAFVDQLLQLTHKNLKKPYLKQLQGLLWKEQYVTGQIKGHLFEDAAQNIARWAKLPNHEVHIYSSGSVQAQKLLFKYSSHGDMTPLISGYHDTVTAGPKYDWGSYDKIRNQILAKHGLKREEVGFMFLSDNLAELKASSEARFDASFFCIRPLNVPVDTVNIPKGVASIVSFDQLIVTGVESLEHMKKQTMAYSVTPKSQLKAFI